MNLGISLNTRATVKAAMPPVSMMGLPGPSSQPNSLTGLGGLGGLSGGKTNVIMFDQTKNPVGGRPPTDLGMLCVAPRCTS